MSDLVAQRHAFGEALVELADEFPRLVVFDADVCASTMTAGFRRRYPKRFYQMGIAEANMVSAAAAMSTLDFIPFVSTFAAFLCNRSADQVRVGVGYAGSNVKLNGAYGGVPTGKAGATHSSIADLAFARCLPGMKVVVPADAVETKAATRLALTTPGPVYMRTTRDPVPQLFTTPHVVEWGKGVWLAEGDDLGLVSTGIMTSRARQVCEQLAAKGVKASLLHLASLKPVDEEALLGLARRCGKLVTLENHSVLGGLGSLVAELLTGAGCGVPLLRVGFPDVFVKSGDTEGVFAQMGMATEQIVEKALRFARG